MGRQQAAGTSRHALAALGIATIAVGCCALLPAATAAQTMVFHLDPLVLEALQTSVDTTPDTFLYRTDTGVQSAKFSEYRDLSSGFNIPQLHIRGDSPASDRYVDFLATNAGRRDARYDAQYGSWGDWKLQLDYNKIVHRFGNDALFLYDRTGPGRFEIADPVQAQLQAAIATQFAVSPAGVNYTFLRGLLQPHLDAAGSIDIGLQRNRTAVTFDVGRMADLGWTVEIKHEKRQGTRPYGASFGFNNDIELVEPIDYDTSSAELRGEWGNKRAGVQVGARYSKFENNISTLVWDNPFRATNGTDPNAYSSPGSGSINGSTLGKADLAPDNRASLAFVNGRARLGAHGWANGRVSYQQLRQDDPLLPYTLNSAIVGIDFDGSFFDPTNAANLPARSADRKVNVLDLAADVGTRLAERVDLTLRYRYYDYDNRSERLELPGYVRFHAVWEPILRFSAPYSYRRENATAEVGFDVTAKTNVQVAYELRRMDRTLSETERTDENAVRLSADSRAIANLAVHASVERGDRSIEGGYDAARGGGATFEEPESTNLPGMRKYPQAARAYDLWHLRLEYMAGERITLTGTYQGRKDDYDESDFGLRNADLTSYGFELGWLVRDGANAYLFANRDDVGYLLRSRQSGAAPSVNPLDSWTADLTDQTDTVGLGFDCEKCGKWDVALRGSWSRTNGNANLSSPPGGTPDFAVGFGNYDDVELKALDGRIDYRLSEGLTAGLSWLWEDYTLDSFLTDGLVPYLPNALLLDQLNGSYRANVFGLHVKLAL